MEIKKRKIRKNKSSRTKPVLIYFDPEVLAKLDKLGRKRSENLEGILKQHFDI